MEQAHTVEGAGSEESTKLLHETAIGFFDSFCQSFVESIGNSDMKLSLDSEVIKALITPTLDGMDPKRAERLARLFSSLSKNALKLSGATLAILYRGMKEKEASAAVKHAKSVVRLRADLNKFEKDRAEESLSKVRWETSL